ncbi:MAG: FIST C-terminal domain-containing protein [Treponema sp.]|nr:FIST C-terminal domain-containing protein [Treponema sp.]
MIKSFSAATREIDDAQAAVAEIKTALNLEKNLLKNSLGIVSCFSEFAETGVLKAICEALPFDCIGTTSCLCSTCGEVDQIIFTITVLTSDDCDFKTTLIPITSEYKKSIAFEISGLFEKTAEKPKLFLSYFPLINTISGDMILAEIDKATGGIPLFGTIAVDHTMDYNTSTTILNGEIYREAVVLGSVYGNPKFSFELASFNEDNIRKQKGIITASEKNILIGVNGKTALEYLEEVGMAREDLVKGLGLIPLIVEYKGSVKSVARAVFTVTPENNAVCGGEMPVGATVAIGRVDANDVLSTAQKAMTSFVEKNTTILAYSCVARYLALGANSYAEAEKISEISADNQYLFAYSGGEICPLPNDKGGLTNFFHNFTTVFCKLS